MTLCVAGRRRAGRGFVALPRVVRAEDLDLGVLGRERPKPRLVVEAEPSIGLYERLEEADLCGALSTRTSHLARIEVRVARMQEPPTRGVDRDPAVTERVPEQRHHEDLGWQAPKGADRLEAEPRLAVRRIGLEVKPVRPHRREVAVAIAERAPLRALAPLGGVNVHPSMREVCEAAHVVEVHVRHHDVPDVARVEAEGAHLTGRCEGGVALGVRVAVDERAREARRHVGVVERPEAGVHQDEAARSGLDDQDVAPELPAADAQAPDAGAAQVVHAKSGRRHDLKDTCVSFRAQGSLCYPGLVASSSSDGLSSEAPRRRPGGRTARVHAAVLAAARDVLREGGAESFSLAEVARRAEVPRATLYRRYGTASRLLREVASTVAGDEIPIPDTGSLRDDLFALFMTARALLTSPVGRALAVRSLNAKTPAETDERRVFWHQRQTVLATVLRRAAARGELSSDLPVPVAMGFVLGPLWFRLFVADQPVRVREVGVLAGLTAAALTAPAPPVEVSRVKGGRGSRRKSAR